MVVVVWCCLIPPLDLGRSATTPPVVMRAVGFLVGTTPYSSNNMRRTSPPPLSNSVAPCLLESRMVPATDVFPDTTQADQRHTQTVIGDYFSDIDDDEQGDEATSRFLDEDLDLDDEAQPLIGGA